MKLPIKSLPLLMGILIILLIGLSNQGFSRVSGSVLLLPMDDAQTNHIKAYGLTYAVLEQGLRAEWLLNYRGGSFIIPDQDPFRDQALLMNITYEAISESTRIAIYEEIAQENMAKVDLDKAPNIAVYVPDTLQPWDDAVRIALEYADIPYDTIWDNGVLEGVLSDYDWLHLHHEDFTGQYGKFFASYQFADWYVNQVNLLNQTASELGFSSVQTLKAEVARTIQRFVHDGGFLFAMCSATETIDLALASYGIPIVPPEIGGIPMDRACNGKLNYDATFAFTDFRLITDPYIYRFSTINVDIEAEGLMQPDSFQLFDFSAKVDPIPTILCQNHTRVIKGFLGQTTAFYRDTIKPGVIILGATPNTERVRYIHRDYGEGFFTFYSGHDPEDYRHLINDPPMNLAQYPNSPGYRLILNNILFPSTRKKKQKT